MKRYVPFLTAAILFIIVCAMKQAKTAHSTHIEAARGSSQENRDYIRKEGKYLDSDKKETNHIETFEEYGKMPLDKAAKNEKVSEQVLQMIEDGYSDADIMRRFPSCFTKLSHVEKARQTLLEEKYNTERRNVQVYYIYGETGTGKTRFVMDSFGYANVYKVTNYEHPFDRYNGEPVLLLDEFRSSLPFGDMLQYLDIYPCRLPARYADKIACYDKVFIVSNIPLSKQYPNIQVEDSESWNALVRRINKITQFTRNAPFFETNEVEQIEEIVDSYLLP